MEDEAGTGGLVAGSHGSFLGEATEQTSHLHEIAGELEDLGLLPLSLENGGGDRISMYIETNPCILVYGWIPPLSASKTLMCALLRWGSPT